jgi:HlyD family secretion protein
LLPVGGAVKSTAMKRAIVAAVVVLVAGAGVYFFLHGRKPAAVHYETAKVTRGNITARVTATGTLSALVTVQVGSQVSGRISQINVDFNSPVKKGQVIARLDPALFQAALASARANSTQAQGMVAKSRATLEKDKKLLERAKDLHAQGLMSQQDFDNAQAAISVDQGDLEAQRGQLEQNRALEHQAEINLAYCTIISPIDGTVISRNVDVGQTVAASLTAPVLFTIAEDLHKMQVDTNVTEGDVGKLRDGMRATFVVDAYANDRFNGVIQQIRNAATTVQNVVTYDAVIEVENTELKLRPGMTANATVVYDRRDSALRVPNAALRFRPPPALVGSASAAAPPALPSGPPPAPEGAAPAGSGSAGPAGSASARPRRGNRPPADTSTKTLWVMRGPKPVAVQVKTGLTDGSFTEIVSGEVNENDAVVLEATNGDGSSATPAATPGGGGNQPPRMRL